MYIVMNVLGLPFDGDTLKERSLGGSESAGYYIARELTKRGHKVTIFTNSQRPGIYDGVRYCYAGEQDQRTPLGRLFHLYAEATPHDVCIIQRHPQAFAYKWASKINLFWVHDLALYRAAGPVNNMLWNVDGVLPVSAWHGDQINQVWGVGKDVIYPVKNGVDLSLWGKPAWNSLPERFAEGHEDKFALLYAARPERGLENLVKPDGIMARLAKISPDYHLYFCGYDNVTPDMRGYYEQLWQWAEERGNCTNLGALTKQELADVERQCDLYVYPTTFEDTSCIMAMECAAAGLPFLASAVGALPETCEGTGSELIPLKDEQVDISEFVQRIKLANNQVSINLLAEYRQKQLVAAQRFSWERAADTFEGAIKKCFAKASSNRLAVLKHFEHVSDIYALLEYAKRSMIEVVGGTKTTIDVAANMSAQERAFLDHIDQVYAFAREDNFKQHYEAYYEYEKQRGVKYGPEVLDGNQRYESVARRLADLPAGSCVLDYGCAHGHYTVNLAKRFSHLQFVGVDITESNITAARKWAADDGVRNAEFWVGSVRDGIVATDLYKEQQDALTAEYGGFDCVIAAEVLEHVPNPQEVTDVLCQYLKPDGLFIATTPYGPWEAIGYKQHHPWRAHLWHFERGDLNDMFGHHPGFGIVACAQGRTNRGETIGSYITMFKKPMASSGQIDYNRKFGAIAPRQTVSLCMIVKDAESTIRAALESCADVVDEVVIGLDETTKDETRRVVEEFLAPYAARGELTFNIFSIPSPLEIGFDEARNLTLKRVTAQWVFWLDADEKLVFDSQLHKYLRNNMYGGYASALRHFTMEPAGLLRTDLPTKLFRADIGAKFYGCVHEHPEIALNKGLGYVAQANDIELSHFAYETEEVRRRRFERNYDLLKRDRQKYPERTLGKFLWVRDVAQSVRWALERNGGVLTPDMEQHLREGLKLWDEVVKDGNTRLILDGLAFYSEINMLLGEGFEAGFVLDTSKANGGLKLNGKPPVLGRYRSVEDARQIMDLLLRDRTRIYESKYF